MKNTLKIIFISALIVFATSAFAEDGVENLSKEVRALLSQEMVAIESAMKDIVSANATGNTQKNSQYRPKN